MGEALDVGSLLQLVATHSTEQMFCFHRTIVTGECLGALGTSKGVVVAWGNVGMGWGPSITRILMPPTRGYSPKIDHRPGGNTETPVALCAYIDKHGLGNLRHGGGAHKQVMHGCVGQVDWCGSYLSLYHARCMCLSPLGMGGPRYHVYLGFFFLGTSLPQSPHS